MKKLIAAALAVLCLAGCSSVKNQVESATTTVTKTEAPVVSTEQEPVQEPVEHIEIEIEEAPAGEPEEQQEASTPAAVPSMPETKLLEGLVGDAVGYSLEYPVFEDYAAAETMNAFYLDLVSGLEAYAQETVNGACLERNCIASVYGTVTHAVLVGSELQVGYECRVEYSDTEEPTVNTRTDFWNVETGDVTSEVG